ncbi:MAG: cyclic nucleotide-binding domain-containing protein, partial [Planctomycetota bacterium]
QGDQGDKFFVIRSGRVMVRRDPGNNDIAEIGPGGFFGETALVTGEPRNAHVDALEATETFWLDAESFAELMQQRKSAGEEIRNSILTG